MEVYLHSQKLTQSLWIIFGCLKKFRIQYQIYQFAYFFPSEIYMFLFSESSDWHKSDLPNQQVAPSAKTVPTRKWIFILLMTFDDLLKKGVCTHNVPYTLIKGCNSSFTWPSIQTKLASCLGAAVVFYLLLINNLKILHKPTFTVTSLFYKFVKNRLLP